MLLLATGGGLAVAEPTAADASTSITTDRTTQTDAALDTNTPTDTNTSPDTTADTADPPAYDLAFDPIDTSAGDTPYAFGIPGPTEQTLADIFDDEPPDGVVYTLVDGEWQQVSGDTPLDGLRAYVLVNDDPATATVEIRQDAALYETAERPLDGGANLVTPTAQGPVNGPLTFQLTDGDPTQVQNPFQAPTESPGFESDFSQASVATETTIVNPFAGYFLVSDSGVYVSATNSGMDRTDANAALNVPVTTALAATDQAAAAPTAAQAEPPDPAVVADTVAAEEDATVVVTDSTTDTVVGTVSKSEAELTGDSVAIDIEPTGQPGPHTIHLIPDAELEASPTVGETLPTTAADSAVRTTTITVFEAAVEIADQAVETPVDDDDITVETATLRDGADDTTPYQVTLYGTAEDGTLDPDAPLGVTPVHTGSIDDVPIALQDADGDAVTIDSSDDVVARLHRAENADTEPGTIEPPETFDPLPLAGPDGRIEAGVSDRAHLDVAAVTGTTLSFEDQALGIDVDGNAVVYVDELSTGELTPQVSDPEQDFVVLFEGETLTPDSVVDLARLADAEDGELLLSGTDVTPGTHTVAVVADSRSEGELDTDALGSVSHPALTTAGTADEPTDTEETYLLVLEEDLEVPTIATEDDDTDLDRHAALQQQAAESQAPVVETLETLGAEVTAQYWIANVIVTTVDPTAVSKADLEAIPDVEYVEPSVEYAHPAPQPTTDDPALETESTGDVTVGLDQIDLQQFESEFDTRGDGARIAILDDGLDPEHPDIDVAEGVVVDDGDVEGSVADLERANGHGEHVAGTATGAAVPAGDVARYGVAPDAELYKADVFVDGAPTEDLLAGIQWAVEHDADVVSMSLGVGGSESTIQRSVEEVTRSATDAGTVVIGSSGNAGQAGTGGPVSSPGAEFSTVGVGAIDQTGSVADFSSGAVITPHTATTLDGAYPATYPRSYVQPTVTAPGVDVVSAGPLGEDVGSDPDYSIASGTSMAAPHVAGAVGLIQSATATDHSPTAIETALAETATSPPDADSSPTRQSPFGAGSINVTAATRALAETTTIDGTVIDASDDSALAGASVTTDSGAVAATRTDGTYEVVTTADEPVVLTIDAFGFTPVTESVAPGDPATINAQLEPAVDGEIIETQPATMTAGETATITAEVRNLETYTVDLTADSDLPAEDVTVTLDGEPVTLGEPLADPSTTDGTVEITVTIDEDAPAEATFALDHTLAGAGTETTITTGPTTVIADPQPAFELTAFEAPDGQPIGTAEPYAATVTVTNVGSDTGSVSVEWFLGPLVTEDEPDAIELEPGASETVTRDLGALDVGSFFDDEPVRLLQGFEAVPEAPGVQRDLIVDDFTVGDGTLPILDPLGTDRDVGTAATVSEADIEVADQSASEEATEITVSTAAVEPATTEYVAVVSADTDAQPVLGTSDPQSGAVSDLTVTLEEPLDESTDIVVTLHPADAAPDAPIRAYDPFAGEPVPVSDSAQVSVTTAGVPAVTDPDRIAATD